MKKYQDSCFRPFLDEDSCIQKFMIFVYIKELRKNILQLE